MLDEKIYGSIFNAAHTVLQQNVQTLGNAFCQGFVDDYDIRLGNQNYRNAEHLINYVTQMAQRLNNGSLTIRDDQQLFDITGEYVKTIFNNWVSRQRQTPGFGQGGGMFNNNNGGGFGYSQQSGFMGNQNRNMGFGQQPRMGPSTHLMDDVIEPAGQRQTAQQPQVQQPVQINPKPTTGGLTLVQKDTADMGIFSPNPLDKFASSGLDFHTVPTGDTWGGEYPKHNIIVVTDSVDLKTKGDQFLVRRAEAQHQVILDNPMDVVKDFFNVVPESILADSFMFRILYNHLEVIDVPTVDFEKLRNSLEHVQRSTMNETPFYKYVMNGLNTLQRGPWKALSQYLVKHINRALHLNCRLASQPNTYIQISDIEDLDELLSSTFRHAMTSIPQGRDKIKRIVESAIWNAISANSGMLFNEASNFPVNAVRNSGAFPFGINHVYPDRAAIPNKDNNLFDTFVEKMNQYELSNRTYIVSKRSVIITNILGQQVLPQLHKNPCVFEGVVPALLNKYTISHLDHRMLNDDFVDHPILDIDCADSLANFYKEDSVVNNPISSKTTDKLPVDQTIFAIQYGGDPFDYIASLDVFSTMDTPLPDGNTILAKRPIRTINPN